MSEIRESVTLVSGGKKIFGCLHLPVGDTQKKYPVALLFHGLGGNKSGKSRLFVRLSELLATKGIAVLRFDMRGSGDSEGNFEEVSLSSFLEDIDTILRYVAAHPQLDEKKVCSIGRSFGGLLACLSALKQKERVNVCSLVLWAPVFDAKPWQEKMHTTPSSPSHLGGELSKTFIDEFFAFNADEAMTHLLHIPLLHIQGKEDQVIDCYHKLQYERVRKKASAATRFLTLHHSDHDFMDRNEQHELLDETLNWVCESLK